ncbi:MAG TPA: hypothetical protein DCQ99_02600, partial [Nitrospinae bacterium]|nr:hypothetical protein [Nitrospinota bacterium]
MILIKTKIKTKLFSVSSYSCNSFICVIRVQIFILSLFFSNSAFANPLDLEQPMTPSPHKLKIGCVLPLSGEGADIGQSVLEGIQLAFNSLNIQDE